jgi:hypothetical protein
MVVIHNIGVNEPYLPYIGWAMLAASAQHNRALANSASPSRPPTCPRDRGDRDHSDPGETNQHRDHPEPRWNSACPERRHHSGHDGEAPLIIPVISELTVRSATG